MKKLLSVFVMICLSLLFIWAAMSWYFGVQANNDFRQSLDYQTEKLGEKPFRFELLEYKKHFLGSSASVRVSSDIPLLHDWLGDFELKLKSLNGPFFITKKGVDVGVSRWFISMDSESFSAESMENLSRIFPESLPTAVLIVGFDKESSFNSTFHTEWLDTKVNAIYNLNTLSYRAELDFTRLNYSVSGLKLSADDGTISFQYPNKALSRSNDFSENSFKTSDKKVSSLPVASAQTTYKTASIQIPRLTIDHQTLSHPVLASLKGNSQITFENSMIDTSIMLNLAQLQQPSDKGVDVLPIDKLKITAQSSGIQQSSFLQLMETKAELDNLMMQMQWELEEHGELPEGQDKIWQLQNQISTLKKHYPFKFYQAVFSPERKADTRNITFDIRSSNTQGQSTLKGYLKPSIESGESTRFVDMLEAEAEVTLDELLYTFISKRSAIRNKQFSLLYKHNKLLMQ